MAINVRRLRRWFLFFAIAVVLAVAGLYLYARIKAVRAVRAIPAKLGVEVQQSTEGFTLSKSEGGRTLFTVTARKAVAFRGGGRAELAGVKIVVYGRGGERYDQIFGEQFEYDPRTGIVAAKGEVHIDLGAHSEGGQQPDQAPPQELRDQIHVRTAGLQFNQKTGIATTDQRIEFRLPQASGSAVGATYDANTQVLTVHRDIDVTTEGDDAARITASGAVLTQEPRQAVLNGVRAVRRDSSFDTDRLTIALRDDNSMERMLAEGGVRANTGDRGLRISAPRGEVSANPRNEITSAEFSGGVEWKSSGDDAMTGRAGRLVADVGPRNSLRKVRASEDVRVTQTSGDNNQPVQLTAAAVDFVFRNNRPSRAETDGAAQVEMLPTAANATRTVATAGKLTASFTPAGRIAEIRGAPNARIVSSSPGQPDKVTTSRELVARFSPTGELAHIAQTGDFQYSEARAEGERRGSADRAEFDPQSEWFELSGSARISEAGSNTTAHRLRFHRATGDAEATGDVKTTYAASRPAQRGQGMFAASAPVHVTGERAVFNRASETARYSGGARIWQGANIVLAQTLEFHRTRRSVVASGAPKTPVTTVLVQPGPGGKPTPVTIRAQRLTYDDAAGTIRFSGGVDMRGADTTMTASSITVHLVKADRAAAKEPAAPSGIDRAIAEGGVKLEQGSRRAAGERLVYTAAEGKFVLSGGPPTVSDAEHGTLTGASLTFWNRDARVLVEGGQSRTVTRTRVPR